MRWKYVLLLLTISACVLLTEAKRFGGGISFGGRKSGSSYGSHRPSAPVIHHSTSHQVNSHPSGSNVHAYPASSGLSGTHSGSGHAYPASPGLSGSNSGSGHAYPPSPGLSGTNSGSGHAYPNTGVSGTHMGGGYPVQHGSIPTHTVTHHNVYQTHYVQPPVIIQQSSGSQFGNILTGLWLYNLGRSASHHHSNSNSQNNEKHTTNGVQSAPNSDLSDCALLITDKNTNKTERLKLPCELVNSFAPLSDNSTANNSTITNTAISNNATGATPSQGVTSTPTPPNSNVSQSNVTTPLPIATLLPSNANVSISQNISEVLNVTTPVPLAPLYTTPADTNDSPVPLAPLYTTPPPIVINSSTNATMLPVNGSTTSTSMPPTSVVSNTDIKPITANATSNLYCVVEMKIKHVRKRTPVECGMLAKLAAENPLEPPPPPKSHTHTAHRPSKATSVTISTTLILLSFALFFIKSL